MKTILVLVSVSVIIAFVTVFVVFPSLESGVNRARANAAIAEQQKLLAQAEVERARAEVVTAKGEADALRMSINQPVALLAIPIALLAIVSIAVLVATFILRSQRIGEVTATATTEQPRVILICTDGRVERLYVPNGVDPDYQLRQYLETTRAGEVVSLLTS